MSFIPVEFGENPASVEGVEVFGPDEPRRVTMRITDRDGDAVEVSSNKDLDEDCSYVLLRCWSEGTSVAVEMTQSALYALAQHLIDQAEDMS